MITALQNFISKKGKFVFVLLLIVVVFSFVLYLAQGTSIFDLLPDPNQEKEEFYGYDFNDPDEMRFLSIENRVASVFGAVIPPLDESMEKEKTLWDQSKEQIMEMTGVTSFDQFKALIIKNFARQGRYDPVFSQATIRAKLVMEAQAKSWGYLADSESHVGINDRFNNYVRELDPSLITEENRSKTIEEIGKRQGVNTLFVESTLYAHFRANQVDRIYSEGGFTLEKEGELDLYANQFTWKAELLSLKSSDLKSDTPKLFKISFIKQPTVSDFIEISYGSISKKILFVNEITDQNSSELQVKIGGNISATIQSLIQTLENSKFEFNTEKISPNSLALVPRLDQLPRNFPNVSSSSKETKISNLLEDELIEFHEEHKNDPTFSEPARTFATMISFPSKNFMSSFPEPEESRLRAYFDLNRDQFELVPDAPEPKNLLEGEKGPKGEGESNQSAEKLDFFSAPLSEGNQTLKKELVFADFKDEIRLRIIEEDRLDAERDAKELAREASLDFLDQINSLRDQLKSKYSNFSQKRNSVELNTLIAESGGTDREISFTVKDMGVQAAILGLERRESERRNNSEPLEEVLALNESLFFTRSTRTIRDGFAIFVLDRKTDKESGDYENASFEDLYREYAAKVRSDAFAQWSESTLSKLQQNENNQSMLKDGKHILIDGKSLSALNSSFVRKNNRLQARLTKLEAERVGISKAERESNSTAPQVARKVVLDQLIDALRVEQDEENENRSLSIQLAEACSSLELGQGWSELEGTEDLTTFVKLSEVYSLRAKQANEEDVFTRVDEIERARAEDDRDLLLRNLVQKEVSKNSPN
jgi:hypothetical protein